jgi:hypothetical protein
LQREQHEEQKPQNRPWKARQEMGNEKYRDGKNTSAKIRTPLTTERTFSAPRASYRS